MPRWIGLTREVSPSLPRCELTHLPRAPIDVSRAIAQHGAYCRLLASLGLEVIRLPADPLLPDSCFVEDTAVVLDEVAIMARPGAPSRRPEVEPVAAALSPHRRIARIEAPARLDGGDVLLVGRRLFVGLSSRTDDAGAGALQSLAEVHGYRVVPVEVRGCLHLKSAVTGIAEGTLLMNPEWIDPEPFEGLEHVEVDPREPWAGNALRIERSVIMAEGFPRTRDRLRARGLDVHTVDASEFLKAEAGVTCKSLVFRSLTVDG